MKNKLATLVSLLFLTSTGSAQDCSSYSLRVITKDPAVKWSIANAISNDNSVAGTLQTSDEMQAYRYSVGSEPSLVYPTRKHSQNATVINNNGFVAGSFNLYPASGNGASRGFLNIALKDFFFTPLSTEGNVAVTAVNSFNDLVGYGYTPSQSSAFLLDRKRVLVEIPSLNGDKPMRALDVNDEVKVVGTTTFGKSFLYDGSTMQDLSALAKTTFIVRAINNSNIVAGSALVNSKLYAATLTLAGKLTPFAEIGFGSASVVDFNNKGDILGTKQDPVEGYARPFVQLTGQAACYLDHVSADGFTLDKVVSFNDSGVIVGQGYGCDPTCRKMAVMLTPTNTY